MLLHIHTIRLAECGSTNDELKLLAEENAPEGTVIRTDHQTRGKGQKDRIWMDEPGESVLFSLLLRPQWLAAREQFQLNMAVCTAVAEGIEELLNIPVQIKWPNDIYVKGRKVCGLLIENVISGAMFKYCIAGIGINVRQKSFPPELLATSLATENPACTDTDRVFQTITENIGAWYLRLRGSGTEQLMRQYHRRLWLKDEWHTFYTAAGQITGKISGVDTNGRLLVETAGGTLTFVNGEIRFSV